MVSAVGSAASAWDSTGRVFLRALWIARVPVASILGALLIFSVAEAQDLFIDVPPDWFDRLLHWTMFYVAAILFWVLPVHFSSRVALQLNHERIGVDTPRRYLQFVVVLPRILSVLCLAVIVYGFVQAWNHVPSVRGTLETRRHLFWATVSAVVLCGVVTLVFLWLSRLSVLERNRLRPIAPNLYDRLDTVVSWCKPRRRRASEPVLEEHLAAAQHNTLISIFLLLLVVFVLDAALAILFLSPRLSEFFPSLESYLPRAVFVPVLLGINIPGLALLGILSHRVRFPLIAIFFAALGFWGLLWEGRHNVRLADPPVPAQRISLADAVERWKKVNCKDGGCPKPIIVAGSGGASRAAFMTGNALAVLQQEYPNFRDRLFAMSTVSGSSLGAAAFLAGLDYKDGSLAPDTCRDKRFQGWFGCQHGGDKELDRPKATLQKRVQLFLANDFLTPVAVTLTFSDMWRVLENRAVRLEKSWEKAWREVTNDRPKGTSDFGKPLSQFLPQERWRPLLIFNGTSVSAGRRIIVSSLLPTDKNGKRLFTDAFDFYEMACPGAGTGAEKPTCDLPLSTAVTMSSRFPLISPAGVIVRDKVPVDRVVDGGYFENFGAQSALELARALRDDHRLEPFILQITNDPSAFEYKRCTETIPWEEQYHKLPPQPPSEFDEKSVLRWASDPLMAFIGTRTARGNLATAEALMTVKTKTDANYAQIRVCPELIGADSAQGVVMRAMRRAWQLAALTGWVNKRATDDAKSHDAFKSLSASWWLSAPVQEYLHLQLNLKHNKDEIELVGKAL